MEIVCFQNAHEVPVKQVAVLLPRLQEMSVTGARYVQDKLSKTTYCYFIDDNLWQVCIYICSVYSNLSIVTGIHIKLFS
jgi:hypothetical protein